MNAVGLGFPLAFQPHLFGSGLGGNGTGLAVSVASDALCFPIAFTPVDGNQDLPFTLDTFNDRRLDLGRVTEAAQANIDNVNTFLPSQFLEVVEQAAPRSVMVLATRSGFWASY